MQILGAKGLRYFLFMGLLIGLSHFSYAMGLPVSQPVSMEFVRVVYEKDISVLVVELIVPKVKSIQDLSRIELMLFYSDNQATSG